MFVINNDGKITISYSQKILTRNPKYNYKEVTIPSEIYHLWEQQVFSTIDEVTLITVYYYVNSSLLKRTFIVLQDHVTNTDVIKLCELADITQEYTFKQQTLRIRINKGKPNKAGKRKQKATMTLTKNVTIPNDEAVFTVDPNCKCLSGQYGLCTVEGLLVSPLKEKKVSKEKKTQSNDNNNTSTTYEKVTKEYFLKQHEKKQQQKKKRQKYKQYIEGNKKEGYYVVNKEKNIRLGAFLNINDVKDAVVTLVSDNWSQDSIGIAKLNIEYYIAKEGYPYIRNTGMYYCLTKEDYYKIEQDVYDNTPFKNISYSALQKIIHDSKQYELPED